MIQTHEHKGEFKRCGERSTFYRNGPIFFANAGRMTPVMITEQLGALPAA